MKEITRFALPVIKVFNVLFMGLMLSFASHVHAAELAVPELSGPVIDEAWILDGSTKNHLQQYLQNLNSRRVVQLQVWTIADLGEDTIENAAIRAFDKWKLGEKGRDNGVLILLAPNNRRVRIEVGRGLEGAIPDALAKRIIREEMTPYLRSKRYSDAVLVGVQSVAALADKEFADQNPQGLAVSKSDTVIGGWGMKHIFLAFIILVFILTRLTFLPFLGGGRRGWGSGGGFGGGGWSGGGGGWSGGGGGSSGGGSSGDW